MAKKARAAKTGSARAWALIALKDPTSKTLARLGRVSGVTRVDKVWRSFKARQRTHDVNAFAEIHAQDREALLDTLRYIEANFSHIEAYEF
ncbi:MAG TPA: hypothetical protein VJA65_08970 [bacterium]|nr:hypothetical protein [bacterium]